MRIKTLPHPIGSIVIHRGTKMIVQKISVAVGDTKADYSIVGAASLGSKSFGRAWIDHDDLELFSEPTVVSWQLLQKVGGC